MTSLIRANQNTAWLSHWSTCRTPSCSICACRSIPVMNCARRSHRSAGHRRFLWLSSAVKEVRKPKNTVDSWVRRRTSRSRWTSRPLGYSSEEYPKGLEVQRLLEVRRRTQLSTVFFGLRTSFTADDNHRNRLCPAERCERLAQFITGILRHAQIEQDGVRHVLQCES